MKQFLNSVWNLFEAMGEARAASVLARAGKINKAKAIYGK
jgi:hypothetical protein